MSTEKRITSVYVFQNGMVAVFDQHGKQMPKFQGHKDDVLPKIRAVYGGPIENRVWLGVGAEPDRA